MSIGHGYTLTNAQINDIIKDRLRPYLPVYLTKVDPQTYGLRYTFEPFTGTEPEPVAPRRVYDDPKLAHQHLDEKHGRPAATEAEYDLREAARFILGDVYRQARIAWKNARHVTDLKAVVKDTGDRWKAYGQAKSAAEAAFSYLRDPEAAQEWTAAVSRLVDTHDALKKAADAFDERAAAIAEVHYNNLFEEMDGYTEALAKAGYPEGRDWPVGDPGDYGRDYMGEPQCGSLAYEATELIKAQEEHVAKIGHLIGTASQA